MLCHPMVRITWPKSTDLLVLRKTSITSRLLHPRMERTTPLRLVGFKELSPVTSILPTLCLPTQKVMTEIGNEVEIERNQIGKALPPSRKKPYDWSRAT